MIEFGDLTLNNPAVIGVVIVIILIVLWMYNGKPSMSFLKPKSQQKDKLDIAVESFNQLQDATPGAPE